MFKYNMFSLKCNKNTLTFFDHFLKLKRSYLQSMTFINNLVNKALVERFHQTNALLIYSIESSV